MCGSSVKKDYIIESPTAFSDLPICAWCFNSKVEEEVKKQKFKERNS